MKLSSLRTWLIVAAGVLLLAGAGIVYVIKNPPLPKGWENSNTDLYRVAVPDGDTVVSEMRPNSRLQIHRFNSSDEVWIRSMQSGKRFGGHPPNQALDKYMQREFDGWRLDAVTRDELIRFHGHPARILTVMRRGKPVYWFVIVAKDWVHDIRVEMVSGGFSQDDADILFRSFRIK